MLVPVADISVIIILYHPSKEDIENVKNISSHYYGVVCDNSEIESFSGDRINKMIYVPNYKNLGIAAAQNKAIKLSEKAKFIVFLDQDSRFGDNYPTQIVEEYIRNRKNFPKLCMLGPVIKNSRTDGEYKSDIHKVNYVSDTLIYSDIIISSGACVAKEILDKVGLNEEQLFIDLVDSEWCWRADSMGYFCGKTTNLTIAHSMGRKLIKIWIYNDIISAPFRYYYQTRNYLWMLRRNYVPRQWKVNNGIKYIIRFFYLPFIKDGLKSWKYFCKGVIDGLRYTKSYKK